MTTTPAHPANHTTARSNGDSRPFTNVQSVIDLHLGRVLSDIDGARTANSHLRRTAPQDRTGREVALRLSGAAFGRRIVGALLALRRAGRRFIAVDRWEATLEALEDLPAPGRPLQVVFISREEVLPRVGSFVYAMQDATGAHVGVLRRYRNGEWFAARLGPNGERAWAGGHAYAEAAAYGVGWLIADR
ncbi:hypothetical protein KBX50_08275 [Micromonospora sp. C51]|uniref:hypothetical protein n=1 Tax=Micromonospora sp. C51 TaxID=2824879 RepID=UPI001B394190|nr:hypothetical protein [Micromonospora sp. C51]MBQ1048460.1 hypothetical protein [Micromonospora sp. C51]